MLKGVLEVRGLKVSGLCALYLRRSFETLQVGQKFGDLHDFIPPTCNVANPIIFRSFKFALSLANKLRIPSNSTPPQVVLLVHSTPIPFSLIFKRAHLIRVTEVRVVQTSPMINMYLACEFILFILLVQSTCLKNGLRGLKAHVQ